MQVVPILNTNDGYWSEFDGDHFKIQKGDFQIKEAPYTAPKIAFIFKGNGRNILKWENIFTKHSLSLNGFWTILPKFLMHYPANHF